MKDWVKALVVGVALVVLIIGLSALAQRFDEDRAKADRSEVRLERQTRALERIAGAVERLERRQKR